jgi:plasmid stabilization system protein ParE
MDLKVVWSPEAIEDIESIAEYIGRDSDFYARAVATRILDTARSIESFPWFIYSYRIIYQVQENRILIVAVIHGKRLIENISDRFAGTG